MENGLPIDGWLGSVVNLFHEIFVAQKKRKKSRIILRYRQIRIRWNITKDEEKIRERTQWEKEVTFNDLSMENSFKIFHRG